MKKNPEKQLKMAITSILLALLVVVTGMAVIYKKNQQELFDKDLKISVLINEIGGIKDQNEKLYQYLSSETGNIQNTSTQIGNLQQQIGGIGVDAAKQRQMQQDLSAANSNLLQLVQKKEQAISDLKQKNDMIAANITGTGKRPGFINILLLGENMQLTDSIMLASVDTVDKKVTLISIPRDIYYNGRKINEYYEKFGVGEMENVITAITGIMPDKYAVFDMSSFAAIIDDVGGIDLDVKKAITDASYPGSNYTYKKVSFNKGEQHMDGARALEYARSRESTTDFDRAGRQQQIILALKQKAEAMDLKDNLDQLTQIYGDVKDRLKTDVSALDALNYYTNYRSFDISDGNVLSTQNYLYSTYDSAGQYILLPYKDSFMAIQNYLLGLIGA